MRIKASIFLIFIIAISIPEVSADLIMPGYSPIEINNKITNIQDYPDYEFIVIPKNPINEILIGRELNYVEQDGTINTPYYKHYSISVYAIEKSKFSEEEIKKLEILSIEEREKYFESINAKEIISEISHDKTKHISDPARIENNFYTIDNLSETKKKPDNQTLERNFMVYLYILIPLICAFIITYIILKRRKMENGNTP